MVASIIILLSTFLCFVSTSPTCPCSFWEDQLGGISPTSFVDSEMLNLGVKFTSDTAGHISAIRYLKTSPSCVGTRVGRLYSSSGLILGTGTSTTETASGWQVITLATPIFISPGTTYVAAVTTPDNGCYTASAQGGGFNLATSDPLHIVGPVFAMGSLFPEREIDNQANYWIDVIFVTTIATLAPTPFRTCPCSLFDIPVGAIAAENGNSLTLGVKFSSDLDGFVTGVRYYKVAGQCAGGLHVGSLYSSAGDRLVSAQNDTESAAGWQFLPFASPFPIVAGTTYVAASYTTTGCFAVTAHGFDGIQGVWPPLRAPGSETTGVFFDSGDNFPQTSYKGNNYWVDVVFIPNLGPVVTGSPTPAPSRNPNFVATLSPTIRPSLAPTPKTCPCSLFDSGLPSVSPPSYQDNPVTLGVQFSSKVAGYIYGIRFYKDACNTGQHSGMLYDSTGKELSQVAFSDETSTGWQTALFDTAIAIDANAVYVAAYIAPSCYSATANGFATTVGSTLLPSGSSSGVYSYNSVPVFPTTSAKTNYWVDVVFDSKPPPPTPTRSPVTSAPTRAPTTRSPVSPTTRASFQPLIDPNSGPGGPILIVTATTNLFSFYYAEILRTEGLNYFTTLPLSAISSVASLASYRVVILPSMTLDASQISIFQAWVSAGGNLIGMLPGSELFGLFGIQAETGSTLDGYLLVDTTSAPGKGIVPTTMQFHGLAKRYSLKSGTSALAQLYSTASQATGSPALTFLPQGSGFTAAFTFELARSVVYTRQGNPAWIGQERDGVSPIRSDDLFFGAKPGDLQPDWVDFTKVAIPQADEQQRLLVNLIIHMHSMGSGPLPRFWYLPDARKAVVVMTGDDHAGGGSIARFNQFTQQSPANCDLDKWECIRGTTYMFPQSPMTDSQAANFEAAGFEVSLHVNTGCGDYTPESLEEIYASEQEEFHNIYPSVPAPITQRHHCIAWGDYTTAPEVEIKNGIRLDTNYYYWPPEWIKNTPGLFTGSALPMRFARVDGSMIDVYQVATQMTDESGQTYPFTSDVLLSRALGDDGYYGVYTVNAHTDSDTSNVADGVLQSTNAKNVAVITAKQMLAWLDARGASNFSNFGWTGGNTYSFEIHPHSTARGLQAMIPTQAANIFLSSIMRGVTSVNFNSQTIKGINYAFFPAVEGSYVATYSTDIIAPTLIQSTPAANAVGVVTSIKPSITFSEALDASTVSGTTVQLQRQDSNAVVLTVISFSGASNSIVITPSATLDFGTAYQVVLVGPLKDLSGNVFTGTSTFKFATMALAQCPCDALGVVVPTGKISDDGGELTLGVKFKTDVDGFITKIRFYKAPGATGTHVAMLWSNDGVLLAQQNAVSETASGWQEVTLSIPIAVNADTLYVASYFLPRSIYPSDSFNGASIIDKPPVTLLQPVFKYESTPSFPTESVNFHYFVDVEFVYVNPSLVKSIMPLSQGIDVSLDAKVIIVFVSSINSASLASKFSLVQSGGNNVACTFTYDPVAFTATFTPTSLLSPLSSYTATLTGISNLDQSKTQTLSWTFQTMEDSICFEQSSMNPIAAENCKVGNAQAEWDINGFGDLSIQGFATRISANIGESIDFKVDTSASAYRVDIYRLGYYRGKGARLITSFSPSASLPQSQPTCDLVAATYTTDCSNWAVSGSWTVPSNAVSGVYIAKLVRTDTNGASHIVFVVRNDTSDAKMVVQTSDTTWQAYNSYGGYSLYTSPRAYKVSYNRPLTVRGTVQEDSFFNAEYPMLRFLERNGYDLTYISGVDTARAPTLLRNHKVFLSVGHDEYWSKAQRAAVEDAGANGVNLAFFSGNEVFWKIRWEDNYRTLVCYKETQDSSKIDPNAEWTGTWRDPRLSPPSDGGRPENALTGTIFLVNSGTLGIQVPQEDGKLRFWRNTDIASQATGGKVTLPVGTLGYEWDTDADNGFRPAGNFRLSSTVATDVQVLTDFGASYESGEAFHALTMHRLPSSALVFGAGTVQWSWGLDVVHDRSGTPADARMQQATVNLFADMGSQPTTLQPALVLAAPSTDTIPPQSVISTTASSILMGSTLTVQGTATDNGGLVGGVEILANGAWHPANGRAIWSYTFVPNATQTVRTRAVDDSGNLESPSVGVQFSVFTSTLTQSPTSRPTDIPTSTSKPTSGPTSQPTSQPTSVPTLQPTSQPSSQSTLVPTSEPTTSQPTSFPSAQPSVSPTSQPSSISTSQPSSAPTSQPSSEPTAQPSSTSTSQPTSTPTAQPSAFPTSRPSSQPTLSPTFQPTYQPSSSPTPTFQPSLQPTLQPSLQPSSQPTFLPTQFPTQIPTQPTSPGRPTKLPTGRPSKKPTRSPTERPTKRPTKEPTTRPSKVPTKLPTKRPSKVPTFAPSKKPTRIPTSRPSKQPTRIPTGRPSKVPTEKPTSRPTKEPTTKPTKVPTHQPTTRPTKVPSTRPTVRPNLSG